MAGNIHRRVVIVNDGHWGQGGDYQQTHEDALDEIEDVHSDRQIDALIHAGDIVHDDETLHQDVIDNFFGELPGGVDWYPVFGNHDWSTEEEWEDDYGVPKDYTFEVGDFGFVVADCGDSRDAGSRASADAEFIESEIDNFISSGKEGVFVCVHFPHADVGHNSVGDPEADEVRAQIRRDECLGLICGHWHEQNTIRSDYEFAGGRWIFSSRIGGSEVSSSWIQDRGLDYDWPELGLRVMDLTIESS